MSWLLPPLLPSPPFRALRSFHETPFRYYNEANWRELHDASSERVICSLCSTLTVELNPASRDVWAARIAAKCRECGGDTEKNPLVVWS